ncbi:MAG: hypothetical protein ACK5LC_02995 [Coprobacillaceae bacterium]
MSVRVGIVILALIMIISFVRVDVTAATPIRDKDTNTAYITEKSAQWTNVDDYLAELTLKINGTESTRPIDVVIVMDRSGSMDMNFIQEIPDGNGGTKGIHNASSPCLNPDHFYLAETGETPTIIPSDIDEMHYDETTKRLTVYNEEKKQWVVLDTENKINLYYQFGIGVADPDNLELAAYHFKMDGDEFYRISKWDTTDVRKGTAEGIWDHADEDEGCYDRWIEAKNAVDAFAQQLLQINIDEGLTGEDANSIALVPFSIRDQSVVARLNDGTPYYRDYLVNNGYFNGTGVAASGAGTITGSYDSKVGWTQNASTISTALTKLFTTHSTDYMSGLSHAYNLLDSRTDSAKKNKDSAVIFLSDGTPDPANGTFFTTSGICAFYNPDAHIYGLTDAIKAPFGEIVNGTFWESVSGTYQRHDVDPTILARDSSNNIIGAYGQDTKLVSVGYMLDSEDSKTRLKNMASSTEDYIDIPTNAEGTTADYLKDKLLDSIHFPGGRNAVLRDEISKYYYIPEDAVLPAGVTIEGTIEDGQTIVWEIGDVYNYAKEDEPTITVPLVLREEYREVSSTTYYPTNNDNPEPDLTTPENGPDGENTGAQLHYTNPDNENRYDTIGTPKLPVYPEDEPKDPDPIIPEPTTPEEPGKPIITPSVPNKVVTGKEVIEIPIIGSANVVTGDKTNIIVYLLLGILSIGVMILQIKKKKQVK